MDAHTELQQARAQFQHELANEKCANELLRAENRKLHARLYEADQVISERDTEIAELRARLSRAGIALHATVTGNALADLDNRADAGL